MCDFLFFYFWVQSEVQRTWWLNFAVTDLVAELEQLTAMHIMPYLQCFVFNVPNCARPLIEWNFLANLLLSVESSRYRGCFVRSSACSALATPCGRLMSFSPVCALFSVHSFGSVTFCALCALLMSFLGWPLFCVQSCVSSVLSAALFNDYNLFHCFDSVHFAKTAEVCVSQ